MAEVFEYPAVGKVGAYTLRHGAWPAGVALPEFYLLSDDETGRHVQWPVEDGLNYDLVLRHAVECLERNR